MKTRKHITERPIGNLEKLAKEVRELRDIKKMTQQDLADIAQLSRRTIVNAEGGNSIGLKEFTRIANALGYELVLRPADAVVFEDLLSVFKG